MGLNVLSGKVNLDEYFLFVEIDIYALRERKAELEAKKETMTLQLQELQTDVLHLINDDEDFQKLRDPSIICVDLSLPKQGAEDEQKPLLPRSSVELTVEQHQEMFDQAVSPEALQAFGSKHKYLVDQ